MKLSPTRFCAALAVSLFTACTGANPPGDANDSGVDSASDATDAIVRPSCASDDDCNDGLYCNGREMCRPGEAGADVRGCVAGSGATVCMVTQRCDEPSRRCVSDCARAADADGDGHASMECPGGDDCDDADANRFPGNVEVCDPVHDEDCDPHTVNTTDRVTGRPIDGDHDGDGYPASACCNAPRGEMPVCGTDCNDTSSATHPAAPEVCDALDNDCDGSIDNGLPTFAYYPDCDGDMFGDPSGEPVHACTPPRATPSCASPSPGAGYSATRTDCDDANGGRNPGVPEVCNGIDDDCDGLVDEAPDASLSCPLRPYATTMVCRAGRCEVAGCTLPREDCDGDSSNGCEVDLARDPAHCGTCDLRCATANGTSACVASECTAATCDPGFHPCDAACARNDSVATCGNSCVPCPAVANAVSTCTGTRCEFVCLTGYLRYGDRCVAGGRPIAPASGSTASSRRPVFQWELPLGADSARVEICSDRACTTAIDSFVATGTGGSPAADLPQSALYWRLWPRAAGVESASPSVAWPVKIGFASPNRSLTNHVTFDPDGDGHPDVAVGARTASGGGAAYLYRNGGTGIDPSQVPVTLRAPAGGPQGFGDTAAAGDVDGDGYADLIVRAQSTVDDGALYLYRGGPAAFAASIVPEVITPATGTRFAPGAIGAAGDLDRDGYADVFVGNCANGELWLYYGDASGLPSAPTTVVRGAAGSGLGCSASGAGDVDGDGYGDVVVGAPDAGEVAILYGGPRRGDFSHRSTLTVPAPERFGATVLMVGDAAGDGYSDVVVFDPEGALGQGMAYVWAGRAGGIPAGTAPSSSFSPGFGATGAIGAGGDVNADGLDDVVTVTAYPMRAWFASPLYGNADGTFGNTSGYREWTAINGAENVVPRSVGIIGDLDGDGNAEVFVSAGDRVGLYRAWDQTTVLVEPDAMSEFGRTFACADPLLQGSFLFATRRRIRASARNPRLVIGVSAT